MAKTFIKFRIPQTEKETKSESLIKRTLFKMGKRVLTKIVPIANPCFENEIDNVETWLVECDSESGIPEREVGINAYGQIIMIMPYKDNYGYWTDNNLLLKDLREHFATSDITSETFENSWKSFQRNNEQR